MSETENSSASSPGPVNNASSEQSGTLNDDVSSLPTDQLVNAHNGNEPAIDEVQKSDGEEQPLEWHEVIELQAFSDRKVWIEEKIKVRLYNSHVGTSSLCYSYWNKCLQ